MWSRVAPKNVGGAFALCATCTGTRHFTREQRQRKTECEVVPFPWPDATKDHSKISGPTDHGKITAAADLQGKKQKFFQHQMAPLPLRSQNGRPLHQQLAPMVATTVPPAAAKAGYGDDSRLEINWRPGWQFHREYNMELERELGSGGCGQVFLAVHKTGISRAVKRVRRDNHTADHALQCEMEAMMRLHLCPHVVRVIDGFVDDTYRYMVMELCFGLDLVDSILEELREEGGQTMVDFHPNVAHVAAVFRDMVLAVGECHANSVYHMDVKPENFIHVSTESLDGGPRVKLMDFGLSRAGEDTMQISPGTRLGCGKYLAPELFAKAAKGREEGVEVSLEKVDMYALGVSLFNLLTGRFPYSSHRMVRSRVKPDLSRLADPEARNLVELLLAADPSQRPNPAEVLQHDFLLKHAEAVVEPLSGFTGKSSPISSFFLEESPAKLQGNGCVCVESAHCPHRAVARTVKKGEVIFTEGDKSRAVYFVARGSFNLVRDGKLYETVESESVFGEVGAFFDRPRMYSAIAAEDSKVFEFRDFGEKLGSTQQRFALKSIQELAAKQVLHRETIKLLRRSPLFKEASEDLLNTMVASSHQAIFNQGEMLVCEEDDKNAIYIVQEGLLESRDSSSSIVGPGEIVGEMSLVFGKRPQETLKALKPTSTLILDRPDFALILRQFPSDRERILASAESRLQELGLPSPA
jgi:serine/threonine protein kinase